MASASTFEGVTIVDTKGCLLSLLDSLVNLEIEPPILYIDLEGCNLSRQGSISVLTLYVPPTQETYLIDIHTLEYSAFLTTISTGTSLKTILESSTILKILFDVRNDSDALLNLFHISLDGLKDL